jgi:hypothetical protein
MAQPDGTFAKTVQSVLGDGPAVLSHQVLVGSLGKDGQPELIFHWYDPVKGLMVRTAMAQPDGTFAKTVQSVLGDGPAVLTNPVLTADVNGRTELVFYWYDPAKGLMVRTAMAQPDGTFAKTVQSVLGDGPTVLTNPVLTADVNGRTELIFYWEDPAKGLMVRTAMAQPDGTFAKTVQSVLGDGPAVLSHQVLVGSLNRNGQPDLIFNFADPAQGLHLRTAAAYSNGTFAPTVQTTDPQGVVWSPGAGGWLDGNGVPVVPNVIKFAQRPDGTLYTLGSDGWLSVNGQHAWANTRDFALAPDGSLYWLATYGLLQHQTPSGWVNVDTNVVKYAVGSNGAVYSLSSNGWLSVNGQHAWANTRDFALAPDGSLYWLATYGLLQRLSPGSSSWVDVDTNVNSISVAPDGTLLVVHGGGQTGTVTAWQNNSLVTYAARVDLPVDSAQPQDDNWSCGPNSASRVLRYYGYNASYAQVRSEAEADSLLSLLGLGTSTDTLRDVMRHWKPDSMSESGTSFARILQLLLQGKPVIALISEGSAIQLDPAKSAVLESVIGSLFGGPLGGLFGGLLGASHPVNFPQLHYIVLNGVDFARGLLSYVDTDGSRELISFQDFQRVWDWSADPASRAILSVRGVSPRSIVY